MKSNLTDHLGHVSSFLAMEVFARAQELEKQGREIIHLEFGEPDFATPDLISNVAIESIRRARTRYTNTQGIEEFRQAVVDKYKRTYGVDLKTSQVLTSSGSSILLYLAMRLLVPPGDEIIMTDLCYACYDNLAMIGGAIPVRVSLRLENGFQLDIDEVRKAITPRTKAILVNSPMNPTGTMLSRQCMAGLAELGIPIISDEIYGDLVYEGEPYSILNFTDNAIALNGLSKFYAMTGWRLGYMIMKEEWMKVAAKVHQNMMISAAHFVQDAGTVAINHGEGECHKMALEFDKRRRFLLQRLAEIGLNPGYNPVGAFYVFLKYPDQTRKSLELAMDILEKTGVALTPGIDFGPAGEGFIRISYANSREQIDKAIDRLQRYFF
jgi:aspartate/methionine/tyrosine aminotransferase